MQTITLTFFRFEGFKARFWALQQMGRRVFNQHISNEKGEKPLSFAKMLGTGGGNGFSIKPNWGVYAWLGVWSSEAEATLFLTQNPLIHAFQEQATEQFNLFLQANMVHGVWDGQTPFEAKSAAAAEGPLAVLTRARIKTSQAHRFWRYVPKVSRSIEAYDKRLFSVGVGTAPLIEQATVSIWLSRNDMMDYAYKNPLHAEVVKKTREWGWYSEELFARFNIIKTSGHFEADSAWQRVHHTLQNMI